MSDLFKIIGAVIFSTIMYAVPILATCSFIFHWDTVIEVPLVFLCIMQLVYIIERNIERED